ncbi:hypothetical protein [Methylobacterium tardum]|uniref:hypothetical protein n=1 Tax=Methylobacterium tardum TaxID=374432 RepID=UPI00361E5495
MAHWATGPVEQDGAVLIDDTLGVFAGAHEAEEGFVESRGSQGDLAGAFVDVEQAALGSGVG